MTEKRLNCVVPGCRRTRGRHKGEPPIRDDEEWICGNHWRLVPRKMKRVLQRANKIAKSASSQYLYCLLDGYNRQGSGVDIKKAIAARDHKWAAKHRFDRIWQRCKREAIERGTGIR